MRSKLYLIAFLIVFASFGVANFYSYARMQKNDWGLCNDCFISFGFPFAVWIAGGFVGIRRFLCYGIAADLCVAILGSIALGWAFTKVFSRRVTFGTPYAHPEFAYSIVNLICVHAPVAKNQAAPRRWFQVA